ncbi:MAG: peptidase domain-containing ABC transporter [Ktedonobacteraceae bacterium]|nr:peptidase domain-containing ABC transporter [Ktedonobacteraceae bacterium]
MNKRKKETASPPRQKQSSAALKSSVLVKEIKPLPDHMSPELAELMAHRERIASMQTSKMQALSATLAKEERHTDSSSPVSSQHQKSQPFAWHIFHRIKQFLRKGRVPVLLQISMVECGAACLAMLLSYYGRKTSVSEVRERCGVGRDGLSALSIVKAARSYGMRVRALSLQGENEFRFVTLPAIIHWEFNHFIVVERWSPQYVDVVDPAQGRRRLTIEEFESNFTGVVILLEPGVHFRRESTTSGLNVRTYILRYFKRAPVALLQVLGASLLLQMLGLITPLLTAVAIDHLIPGRLHDALYLFGIGMILLVVAYLITNLLRALVLIYIQARYDTDMMLSFFEHLLSLPLRFFLQRSSGDLLARLSSNTVIRDTISNQLISTILDGSFLIISLSILLSLSLSFSVVVLVAGLLQVILLLSTRRYVTELSRRELAAVGKSQGYITELLGGVRTLKSVGAEYRALERWSNLFFEQMNISVRRNFVSAFINTAMATLSVGTPLTLLWLGTMQVIAGSMRLGTMLALNALAGALLGPLTSLVRTGSQLQVVQSHLERIADVISAESEQDLQKVASPPKLSGYIRLESVSFQYDQQAPVVVRNVSLSILPGQKVAIVGRTGSGKSTLGNLLLGLCLPTKGQIFYDDIELRSLNYQAVRAQFGVVTQEASVFSGSIRENITLNDPTMGMEGVIKAAKAAALHDDIMQMPMEYETFVSEGGNAISGGQRQRLALARALAHEPAILLLDEATSSLDVVTEQTVQHNIRRLSCTQIIIAHRLSTIRNADVILVMHEGQIVESGSHQELLTWGGHYAQLIQSQELEKNKHGKQEVLDKKLRQFIKIV